MIENITHTMGSVEIYGIISICIFFGFFLGMLLWSAWLKKSYLNSMRNLPLDGDTAQEPPKTTFDPAKHHE